MTRIALLPSSYPPSLGGVEELTRHLALSLTDKSDEGAEVDLVEVWTGHPNDAEPETVEVRDGLVVRRLPMPLPATNWSAIHRSATTGTRTLASLRSALSAFRPDVLHVQCFGPNGAYAAALSRVSGVPLVVTLQGETLMDDADIFDTSRVLRATLRYGLRNAAAVTACSNFVLADAEERFGLQPGRGHVIPNGVVLGTRSALGNSSDSPQEEGPLQPTPLFTGEVVRPYILALGRVVEKKGFDLLLAAYAAMDAAHRTTDLVIAGVGSSLEDLQREAVALGVAPHVHFIGRLDRDEVRAAMAGAELFVMPSRVEPFGIVILEAWREGVAVVATSRGGPPEFVHHGHDGVLVDPFDTERFAAALQSLLADDDHRSTIADAGRASVASFAWPAIANRYRQIYSSVKVAGGDRRGEDARLVSSRRGEFVG